MDEPYRVTLNKTELRLVEYVSQSRYRTNRDSGVVDALVADASPIKMERQGFGAEVAFCKLFNVYPDMTIEPRSGGHDCTMPSGLRIDVKSCTRRTDHLLVTMKKAGDFQRVDAYALMLCQDAGDAVAPEYGFVGWCFYDDILDRACLKTFSTGQSYAKTIDELRPPQDLAASMPPPQDERDICRVTSASNGRTQIDDVVSVADFLR